MINTSTTAQAIVLRAKIILLCDLGIPRIGECVGCSEKTVSKWRQRWLRHQDELNKGDLALEEFLRDAPRPGAPIRFGAQVCAKIVAVACTNPNEYGLDIDLWTLRELREVVISEGIVESISQRQLGRILDESQIKPHKVRYWLNAEKSPEREQTIEEICDIYQQAPALSKQGEVVLSIDEMTGVQAKERIAPDKNPEPKQRVKVKWTPITRPVDADFLTRSSRNQRQGLINGVCYGMNQLLTERFESAIKGVISCFDRIVLFGSFQSIGYPKAMEGYLRSIGVKLVDYKDVFANTLRLEIRDRIQQLAREHKQKIQFVNQSLRKEDVVARIRKRRRISEGIVCILSAMESCRCFKVGKNSKTGYLELQWSPGKCIHYYIYFIDKDLGLCYIRIPTWAPFRIQFYMNGHNWLERKMRKEAIRFKKADNAFVHISDFERAQQLVNEFDPEDLHRRLNRWTEGFISIFDQFGESLYWSIYQAEWATDIVFKNDKLLPDLYDEIVRTAVCDVKSSDVYRFLGKRQTSRSKNDQVDSRLQHLTEGTRIKHRLKSSSIKMYDKGQRVLRIETTTSDVSSFSCRRRVESRDGTRDMKWAPIRKSIYSLGVVAETLNACNRRYLEFISGFVDRTNERHDLRRVVESQRDENERSWRGVNFFREGDLEFLEALLRGEHQIQGIRNRLLQPHLPGWKAQKIGRNLRRFRVLGLLKKVAGTTKYYLTKLGKNVLTAALQLRERVVVPSFS